ncbi:DUF2127 domain-containing protein [Paraburkholderia sp. SIMBA_054]|jgi:uncharacterized membrane protein|uniref:DUF2127 domain-containing protein n=1 Tax=Paraburkholderia TaxID=1822464 RepID=UPI003978A0D4
MRESATRWLPNEKSLHRIFELGLGLKAIFALAEMVAGVATCLVPQRYFLVLALWVTRDEFAEDPHDPVANVLLHIVQHLSVDSQRFAGLYLMSHGVIKLWLVAGLLRERLWYFPVSIVVFALLGLSLHIHPFNLATAGDGTGHGCHRPYVGRVPISATRHLR